MAIKSKPSRAVSVKVSEVTHRRAARLANREHRTITAILDLAVQTYEQAGKLERGRGTA